MLIVTATTFITTSLAESLTLGEHVKDCVETVICHCHWVNERGLEGGGGCLAVSTDVEQENMFGEM